MSSPLQFRSSLSRRQVLRLLATSTASVAISACGGGTPVSSGPGTGASTWPPSLPVGVWAPSTAELSFLDDLERQACLYFWEQASATNGQVLDRAANNLGGAMDARIVSSIAATGFGLSALCIAASRGYLTQAQALARVQLTLGFHLNQMPNQNGFLYHFNDVNTGQPLAGSEVSSIDTAILMCGVLTARAYFNDPTVKSLATQLYERVNWPWMLNNGATFAQAWYPATGFSSYRYDTYCELMMLYLLAIGSPTYPVAASYWENFARPTLSYEGYSYISSQADPLFTHQFSHAWFDFRAKKDAYSNYFNNSIAATQAHETWCLAYPTVSSPYYTEDYWGVSASDSASGYVAWGGPPLMGPVDGSVVPSAAAGSLVFLPNQCMRVLQSLRSSYGSKAWGRYGFVDAFHPTAGWYDADVLGIDLGVGLLMAENLRTQLVWDTFMSNAECAQAMTMAGFVSQG